MAMNYISHREVDDAISPFNLLSVAKLDEATYLSYQKLSHLSRRARYLLNDNEEDRALIKKSCITHSPHFKKAIFHLNEIMKFMDATYKTTLNKVEIKCADLKGQSFEYFDITS